VLGVLLSLLVVLALQGRDDGPPATTRSPDALGSGAGTGELVLPRVVGGMGQVQPAGPPAMVEALEELRLMVAFGAFPLLEAAGEAAYGPSADQAWLGVMVVKSREAEYDEFAFDGPRLMRIRRALGASGGPARVLTHGRVVYRCWAGAKGGVCAFQDGTMGGVGFAADRDLARLSRLTDEARRGVTA
jgi:hypothetical protein